MLSSIKAFLRCSYQSSKNRRLRFEHCEDRRMLATLADIVFLVDESGTEQNTNTQDWLQSIVDELDAALIADGVEVQYGLIGFGEDDDNGTPTDFTDDIDRYAHTQRLGPSGDLYTPNLAELQSAMSSSALASFGRFNSEDGWDGIEHAIAEYEIRDGAVPIFVLVQGDEVRTELNDTLTRNGIFTALESKNAILNGIVPGQLLVDGQPPNQDPSEPLQFPIGATFSWTPLFDVTQYEASPGDFQNIRVLGVEADAVDGIPDGQHTYHSIDTLTHLPPASLPDTQSDALQISYNGSSTGATGLVGTGKSVLIGQHLTGGIGTNAAGYTAKGVPFKFTDLAIDPSASCFPIAA